MDWLKRLLGGVGHTVSNILSAPSKLGQAAGQAVRKEVQQAPRQIQQVQQQTAKVVPNLKVQDLIRGIQQTQKGVTTAKIPGLGVSANQIGAQLPGATLKVLNTGAKVGGNLLDRGLNPIKYQQQAINKAPAGWQKNIAQGITDIGKLNPQMYANQLTGSLLKSTAQSVAQAPVRVALSTAGAIDRYNGRQPGITSVRPTNDITRALLGNDKVEGLASYGKSLPVVGNKLGVLAPVAGLALTAGDVAFGGEGKTVNALSKASTASGVTKLLKADKYLSKLDPAVAKSIAVDIAKTTDKKAIQTILRDAAQGKTSQVKTALDATGKEIKQFAPTLKIPVKKNIHPDDQAVMRDFIDYTNGIYRPPADVARRLELDAARIAEKHNLPMPKTTEGLANQFDYTLQNEVKSPVFAPSKTKGINQNVPKSVLRKEPTVGQAAKAGDVLPGQVGKERGFISTVRNSASTAPQVALKVKADYVPKTNDALVKSARSAISSDIMEAEKIAKTQITDKGVATASELIKHYQAIGQYDKAVEVAQQAAKNLTEAGRTVQAASIYSRISPEGILRSTQAQIDKVGGKKLSGEVAKRLTEMARAVQTMPDGPEKLYAVAELQKEVARQIPTGILQKLTTFRKAGLLTGLKTQMGNAVSNLSHIGLNKVSDLPASAVDAMTSLFTGQRSKVFTLRGEASGAKEGIQKAGKFLKTGIDELALGSNKYDITPTNFNNKAVQKYTDTVFNLMGAADKPYRYSVFKNQLFDIGIAEAKNKGLRGAEAGKFVKDFVKNPPMEAAQTAMGYAEKSVFGNDTVLSGIATSIRQAAEKKSPPVAAALDIIMPFTKVPSAVITRLFDYTPVGAVKEVAKQVKNGKFDQRMFAQAMGEAGTGTGVLWLGTNLAQKGLITGPMPTDQRERDLWTLEGKQPNAIRFGDKWYSFNYTSPVGQVLQMGAQVADGLKQGKNALAAIGSGVAGGSKAVVDQSFLQGVQGALDAITDPKRYAEQFAKSTAGSIVPTLLADVAKATDPLQRQTNSIPEAITTRIPGLRLAATPKQDAFGRPLARAQSPLGTMVDPFRTTTAQSGDQLQQELRRLQDQGVGVLPDINNKTIKVGKEQVNLTPQQLYDKNARVGSKTNDAWAQTIADPQYIALSDDKKRKVLSNLLSDINEVEKAKTLQQVRPDLAKTVVDNMTKTELALYNGGGMNLAQYIANQQPKVPKPKIAKAKVARAKKAKLSSARGRKAKTAKLTIKKVKVAKFGKLATMKTPKIKVAKMSAPKLRAARKAKKVKLVA